MKKSFALIPIMVFACTCLSAAQAQDIGTSFGVPNSSPPVIWPRGMSIETLSPNNLYPNGPQFGLSNTSGGFGLSGTGPSSGIGLAERTLSPLILQSLSNADDAIKRGITQLNVEEIKANSDIRSVLSNQYRREINATDRLMTSRRNTEKFEAQTLPGVDKILHDAPFTTDSILKDNLSGE